MNKGNTILVVPLSTKYKKQPNGLPLYKNHYLFKKEDYPALAADSVAKFEDMRSIDVVRLRGLICNVSSDDMERMKSNVNYILGY
jgi:mRNA-degrading endonuclease toxin of MazEF toxin-antitoxin module